MKKLLIGLLLTLSFAIPCYADQTIGVWTVSDDGTTITKYSGTYANITEDMFPEGVTTIEEAVFQKGKDILKTIVFPETITKVGYA